MLQHEEVLASWGVPGAHELHPGHTQNEAAAALSQSREQAGSYLLGGRGWALTSNNVSSQEGTNNPPAHTREDKLLPLRDPNLSPCQTG